jgi:hypothetical protein
MKTSHMPNLLLADEGDIPCHEKKLVRITKDQLEAIFARATRQGEYIEDIYRLVFPNWAQLKSVDGHPWCNKKLWEYICGLAMAWDRRHVGSLPGGAWLNWGFSNDDSIPDWHALPCPVTLTTSSSCTGCKAEAA